MLFLYGVMTSVHCVGMCGGIIMTVAVGEKGGGRLLLIKQLAYHGGRMVTAALTGLLLGMTGMLFYQNTYFRFLFPVVCGSVMIVMGLVHMGLIKKKLTPASGKLLSTFFQKAKGSGPFLAGMLTELLPCGGLNAAQVYAAGTGSVLWAAAEMCFFVAGTIPVLLLFGTLHGLITGKTRGIALKISAGITILLGIRLLLKGMNAWQE